MKARFFLAGVVLAALGVGRVLARSGPDRFDHAKHAQLFPSCVGCHAGAVQAGAPLFPAPPRACASCHDGREQRAVNWTPREGPRASNLAFDHLKHPANGDCLSCHADPGAEWLQVRPATPTTCFACHGTRTDHLAQADSTCGVCHRSLPDVPGSVTPAQVATWPAPSSHQAPRFGAAGGHGEAAKNGDRSCATCHAQNFCAECHVNGAAVPAIAALRPDPRAIVLTAAERRPTTHGRNDFDRAHAGLARGAIQSCATCHTQTNCLACHVTLPRVATTLATTAASVHDTTPARHAPPPSHRDPRWESAHGALASARPQNCATCHARTDCLECHRAGAAQAGGGYHPTGFLVSHPAQAYGRQTSCAECHNTQSFCQDCHRQAGIVASGRLQGGFHDSKQAFALNHGQAARQSLESCVSCHAERDCLACHSATRGRGFNPHGPGFDGDRLKRKNPGLCAACHAHGSV